MYVCIIQIFYIEPDQVHYLKVEITSNISVNISWHPPATLKGIVINYHLILRNITREHSDFIMSLWILESSDLNHHIQGLCEMAFTTALYE